MSTVPSTETLPTGWKVSSLGDVAKWGSGGTPKSGTAAFYGGPIRWAVIGDLTESLVSETAQSITKLGLEKSSAKVIVPGTVMLAMYGASIGRTGIAAVEMATNQAIAFAVPQDGILDAQYLLKYLQSQKESFVRAGQGGAQPNISQTVIKPWPMPLPPIDEQEKIVEILEEQLSRLDAALASVRAVRVKSARFRRSLLHAAFAGALTGHDTSDETLPDGWGGGSLGEFCEMYQPKTISTKELIEDGEFPVYGANGQIGFYDKYNHEDSEVTVTCRGATCGTVNVIPGKSWITGNAMVVRPIDNCMSKQLLSLQLQSLDFTQVITGTAQPQITRTTLTEIRVTLPPLMEQNKIVEILEAQLSRLDASFSVADLIEKKASALRRSLLHAAFTGELTKEWREGAHV